MSADPQATARLSDEELARIEALMDAAPPRPWLLHETGGDDDPCPRVDVLWTLTTDTIGGDGLTSGDLLYLGAPDNWQMTPNDVVRMRTTARAIQAAIKAVPALIAEVRRQRRVLADLASFDAEVFRIMGHEAELPPELRHEE